MKGNTCHVNDYGISNGSRFLEEFLTQIRSFQEKLTSITAVSGSAEEHFHSIPTCFTLNTPGERKKRQKAQESNGTAIHGKTPLITSIKEDHKIICGVLDQDG